MVYFDLGRVDAFFRSVSKRDRVAIVHDVDPDGILSAVILARCIRKLRDRKPEMVVPFDKAAYSISDACFDKMKKKGINKLIITDFSPDQKPELVKKLNVFDVLVIDHHKIYRDLNGRNVVFVKPQLFSDIDPCRYCSAKLAYDLCSRVCDMGDCDWLAVSASIADVATEPWHAWIKGVFSKYGYVMKADLFNTELGEVAAVINSVANANPRLISKCCQVAYKAKSADDILNSELRKYRDLVDEELNYWLDRFKSCERHGDLYLFFISPKYNLKSTLSTILGLKYPHKTILVIDRKNGFISVSARRGDKRVAVNALLEKAIKGFSSANAGGHVPAAGARFLARDIDVFKKRLVAQS